MAARWPASVKYSSSRNGSNGARNSRLADQPSQGRGIIQRDQAASGHHAFMLAGTARTPGQGPLHPGDAGCLRQADIGRDVSSASCRDQ